ncbi:MAG: NADH-quinone oxidoreductase subunit M [Planctomycetes bacterium]|nr:NADH-quinone oxidoreductase subunit M [Planctomycetota bacterium]
MLLLSLVLAPIAAAAIAVFAHGKDADQQAGDSATRLGLVISLAIAVLSVPLVLGRGAPLDVAWFALPGTEAVIHLSLGSDGISAWLVQLVTWLTPFAILGGRGVAGGRMREYLAAVFVCEAMMIGALLARDLVLFYVCFEAMLLPVLVLLALFGGPERRQAALWFVLMTMLGSVPMLVGIWVIAAKLGTTGLAPAIEALRSGHLPASTTDWLFWSFALAFAVKVPLVPLHAWQARTYSELPGGVAVLVAGAMAKLGVYGFLQFVLPLFPEQSAAHAQLFIVLGVIGAVGGAVVALAQDDAKRLLAYSSLSHLGLVVAGIFTFQQAALAGAAVQMVAHGLSAAALFLLVGAIEERTRSPYLDDHGAFASRAPLFSVLFVISALAAAGLPGTANFAGEFLLLLGAWQYAPWVAAVAGLSVILGAAYLLILVQKWCYGSAPEGRAEVSDLTAREAWAVVPLLAASIWLGFQPGVISRYAGPSAEAMAAPARSAAAAVKPGPTPAAVPTVAPATAQVGN